MKPHLLDLFSGAGGCTRGYQMAGFFVVGVDIASQPRYIGDGFIQADALDILRRLIAGEGVEDEAGRVWRLEDFMLIHASPPCQSYTHLPGDFHQNYEALIADCQALAIASGKPYVIENVSGARRELNHFIMLCGHQFGLKTYRHRFFETNPFILAPPHLPHPEACPPSGRGKSAEYGFISVTGNGGAPNLAMPYLDYASMAMGISWMNRAELSEAIPPAMTAYIGRQMLAALEPTP
jgi:DNA (cytosine-5)-methyltransferase 1